MRYIFLICALVFAMGTGACIAQDNEMAGDSDEYTYASGDEDYADEAASEEETAVYNEEEGMPVDEEIAIEPPQSRTLPREDEEGL